MQRKFDDEQLRWAQEKKANEEKLQKQLADVTAKADAKMAELQAAQRQQQVIIQQPPPPYYYYPPYHPRYYWGY